MIALINPKGCRVTSLGSHLPPGSFITTGEVAKDQKRPRAKAVHMQGDTQMKHRNDGFILPEYAFIARPAEACLLSVATGKFQNGKAGLVRPAVPIIHNHALAVTEITYNSFLTLIMCRYSASSSEARQAPLPEKLELIRASGASIPGRPPRVIRSRMAAQKQQQPAKGPLRSRDKHVRAVSGAALTTPKRITQLPDTANSAVGR